MIYKCTTCGYLYDAGKTGIEFSDLAETWSCSVCDAQKSLFVSVDEMLPEGDHDEISTMIPIDSSSALIQQMAQVGKTIHEPGGTRKSLASWDDVLFMGACLARKPLENTATVNTKTLIGRMSPRPMEIETPIMISHMSLGAISHSSKVALAKASTMIGTSIGSGEGGVLSAELDRAHKYIIEYTPSQYSINDANLQRADAIEVKIGQAARTGMGSGLDGDKVTAEVAALRGAKRGKAVEGPVSFNDINEPWDLLLMINNLRERSGGRPVGIKIAAGHIEEDLKWIKHANPDFITIDGRGGGTSSSPVVIKDATGVPTLYALYRTRKFVDENGLKSDIIVTGGLRTSADFVKALALGADAVAIATAALIAMTASGDLAPEKKVANFINTSNDEIKRFARAAGYHDIGQFNSDDLATINSEIANYTNIRHV